MVGEIRDHETAEIAIRRRSPATWSSTLHTNDAAGAVTRLLDMGSRLTFSLVLVGVFAQRLVRPLCQVPAAPRVVPQAFAQRRCARGQVRPGEGACGWA